MRHASIILVVAALTLAGCGSGGSGGGYGGSGDDTAVAEGPATVAIQDFAYAPEAITVPAGTTIEFPNEDGSPHTATSDEPGLFDTDRIEPDKSAELTFDEPGEFAYYCVFHPFMKGTVTVE